MMLNAIRLDRPVMPINIVNVANDNHLDEVRLAA
jgi:hypothetical protein